MTRKKIIITYFLIPFCRDGNRAIIIFTMLSRGVCMTCMTGLGRECFISKLTTVRTPVLPGCQRPHSSSLLGRRGASTARQRPLSAEERLPLLRSAEKRPVLSFTRRYILLVVKILTRLYSHTELQCLLACH